MNGTTCTNRITSPINGSGIPRRNITSYQVHKARLVDQNRQPAAIKLQNSRICPRLETALATITRKAKNRSRNCAISPKASKPNPVGTLRDTIAYVRVRATIHATHSFRLKDIDIRILVGDIAAGEFRSRRRITLVTRKFGFRSWDSNHDLREVSRELPSVPMAS